MTISPWIKPLIAICFLSSLCFHAMAQDVIKKKLHRNICSSIDDEVAPFVSADGRSIAFLIRDSYTGKWLLEYAKARPGGWDRSTPVDVVNKSTSTNHLGGHALSADGNILYYTTRKYGGVGQSDIWFTKRNPSGTWSEPENLGKPINSSMHEANPRVSADGKYLYFMRCSSLASNKSECCKIMVAERKGANSWTEPKELPAPVNTGCESSPRIAADNKTLYFASGRAGGKGGLDLYMSQKEGTSWSQPVPLDFVNTEMDDQFITLSSQATVMYFHAKEDETKDMYKLIIPEDFRPDHVVQVTGKSLHKSTEKPLKSIVRAYDLATGEIAAQELTNKEGKFVLFLPVGKRYDFSVNPLDQKHLFFSAVVDATEDVKFRRVKFDAHLHGGATGDMTPLHNTSLDESGRLTPEGQMDLKRMISVMKKTPNHHYEILCFEEKVVMPELMDSSAVMMDSTSAVDIDASLDVSEAEDASAVEAITQYLLSQKVPPSKIQVRWIGSEVESIRKAYLGEDLPSEGVVVHVLRGS